MVLPAMRDTNFVLVFSFVGMRTQEIKYVGQDSINVVMEEDHKKMDEVVVTGYSNIRKESFTGKATVSYTHLLVSYLPISTLPP